MQDPRKGPVRLFGLWSEVDASDTAVVLVHGLGGGVSSFYCREAARFAVARGWSVLNVGMRGADASGEDMYHCALAEDLHAIIGSLDADRYRKVHLVGFSIGGHLAFQAARGPSDSRLRSAVAICAPLDLQVASQWIDSARSRLYRAHVLRGLKEDHAALIARNPHCPSLRLVLRARTLREMDALGVVPRFGFRDVDDYYAKAAVAPHMRTLAVPVLYVGAARDPMVPAHLVTPFLPEGLPAVTVRISKVGGHLGFPRSLDLGLAGSRGLMPQVLAWCARHQ